MVHIQKILFRFFTSTWNFKWNIKEIEYSDIVFNFLYSFFEKVFHERKRKPALFWYTLRTSLKYSFAVFFAIWNQIPDIHGP